ncbi:RidA family protein [Phytoactinopolyspora alkaliphila]|uniref:RidA family protein n=1 Tax=Phytoactinopolyspora alkaliphila TaxID=1783498 RepID=A0A6N9YLQ5_9ACTN|nr:RidA family protein [Phytoactinopolyspora alkaliphila]NED95895.1 RidA family protein [Phytoactinopolyspora alkaliphila]
MFQAISSPDAPPPAGPYSPGVVVGNLLFLAGQGPFDAAGRRVGETFADQVRQTFRNLEAVAKNAGTSLEYTVRYGVYLRSLDDFAEFNEVAREFLSDPLPARTTIEVALRGFDVEIDAVVAVPSA